MPHDSLVPPLAGVVMAGGVSRRFGRDKAAIDVDGTSLLERTVTLLQTLVDDVFVSVNPGQTDDALRSRFALLVDVHEGIGPVAGLLAAHRERSSFAWLAVACDMPQLDAPTLNALIAARDAGRAATAMVVAAGAAPEPLCAIYEPATLARFKTSVADGHRLSPRQELTLGDTRLVIAGTAEALKNVNRPDDWS